MAQQKVLQTRISKMENYEKCWLHRCIYEGEEILVLLEDLQLQGIQANVEKLSYIQSHCDSAESIATPPDSDLEDEQLRKMLASPLYVREREGK